MSRTTLVTAALVTLTTVAPVRPLAAQVAPDSLPPAEWAEADRGPSLTARIASGVGGALLGAGLGFFASQVRQGDWQEATDGSKVNRGLWAALGGGVGFSFGVKFPVGGRGGTSRAGFPTGRNHITFAEMEGRGFNNAYNAVTLMRPDWLQVRGNRSLAASIDPVVVDGTGSGTVVSGSAPLIDESLTIQVYQDEVRRGGLETLRSIDASIIRDIYYFDTARATARWGGGNPHGAILVITSGG